jgi:radical SAM protein with 4Fe4S-binding SPASM domain
MPMNVFEKVLADYSAMGGGLMSLTPMVGELFLDKQLVKRLRLIEGYPNIGPVTATTNAVMASNFDDEELELILRRLGKVQISIYGIDDEEYQAMTLKNTYKKMIGGIHKILRYASGDVVLAFRFLKDRSESDIECWLDENIRVHTDGKFRVGLAFNTYSNWGLFESTQKLPFAAKWSSLPEGAKTQCIIPLLAMQIYANGDVSYCACSDFDSSVELRLGNVMNDSLLDLYNSNKARKLWRWDKHGVPSFCQKCTFHQPMSKLEEWPWFFDRPLDLIGG